MCWAAIWSTVTPPYGSCVGRGVTPLSHVPGAVAWTDEPSAALLPSPLITVNCFLNGSSGFRMVVISNSPPSAAGVHSFMMAPWGK